MATESTEEFGEIVRTSITMSKELMDAIDDKRGTIPRSTFIEYKMRPVMKLPLKNLYHRKKGGKKKAMKEST